MKLRSDLIALTALMVLLVSLCGFAVKRAQDSADQANRTLCALKQGYKDNYDAGQKYLKQHPDGVVALGLTRADVQRSQTLLKQRIDDLGHC